MDRLLWAGVLCVLVADLLLTAVGLAAGATESNPFALAVMDVAGLTGLVVLKVQALAVGVLGWHLLPDPVEFLAPLSLFVPWLGAALWNLGVLVR